VSGGSACAPSEAHERNLLCRSAAQSLGVEPVNLLLDASVAAPAATPALTGLPAGLSAAGSLVNETISGVRADLQSVAARFNLTVSQVRGNPFAYQLL
jgi:hypothetical protein